MILRLRGKVPLIQSLSGWASNAPVPPVVRRCVLMPASSAAAAASNSDPDGQVDRTDQPSADIPIDGAKKKRGSSASSTRRAKEVEKAEAAASTKANASGVASDAAETTSAPKRRSRKAAAGADEQQQPLQLEDGTIAPPKRTRRKKAEATTADAIAEGISSGDGADAAADAAPAAAKKRSGKSTTKKALAIEPEDNEPEEELHNIRGLPYEDCLVLPRKAEQILIALGIRPPLGATGSGASTQAPRDSRMGPQQPAGGGKSLANVMQLAGFLGWKAKTLAPHLLTAQYQRYLGDSPDYLYDLLCLDFEPPYLSSDTVRSAVLAAARAAKRGSEISAKGTPPESLHKAALEKLREAAGPGVVEAQDAVAAELTAAQLEMFLLDWASAKLAGLEPGEDGRGTQYLARRCAALQLTRPVMVERLHRYVRGASLQELASGSSGRLVKMTQPMEALVEGVKAGVRLDRQRLLQDFRLGPGEPMHDHLPELERMVAQEETQSSEPGSSMFYSTLVDKFRGRPALLKAMNEQERRWSKEQNERDSTALTTAQVRLLFHMGRLERFRAEQQTQGS